MQDNYNNNNNNGNNGNMNRQQHQREGQKPNVQRVVQKNPQRTGNLQQRRPAQTINNGQQRPTTASGNIPQRGPADTMSNRQPRRPGTPSANMQQGRQAASVNNGQQRRTTASVNNGQPRRQAMASDNMQQRQMSQNASKANTNKVALNKKTKKPSIKTKNQGLTPKQQAKKKRNKILLFIGLIFVLLLLLVAFWAMSHANRIIVEIDDKDPGELGINEEVLKDTETGVMKGYKNIALFGVDSREGALKKNTRTDAIMIASINLDTKEVKLVSVYRDTWLNLSTDKYGKANSAYAKGGAEQAIEMLNMNLDMNITDYVTTGFRALIDVIDAVGGIEIDVKEAEIVHLNSFQISMVGKPDGTLNAAGEPNYTAREGVDYTPVTRAGLQTLNGLQATAYCRIRYVGNDFQRTQRQRTVLEQIAKKAITLNPAKLNNIANAISENIQTSLEMSEILSLISDVANYQIGESSGFPFDDNVKTGNVGTASVVIPVDLEKNVSMLHKFFFGKEDYEPSETVKECSQKIVSDTGVSASQ